MLTKGPAVLAGLLLAGIAQFVAFALAGAGEGWSTPFGLSPLLFIANPIAFVRAFGTSGPSNRLDRILLAFGIVADILVVVLTYAWEAPYFSIVLANFAGVVMLWVALWIAWQAAILHRILRWQPPED